MKLPRISIGGLMFGIAMLCVPLGIMSHFLQRTPWFREIPAGELGLWPTVSSFGFASFWIGKSRGKVSPFLWGFVIAGWASVFIYVSFCLWLPWVVEIPVLFYLNDIYVWWLDWLIHSDRYEMYVLNQLTLGLILAAPQLMMAVLGGLIARFLGWKRWNTTSS